MQITPKNWGQFQHYNKRRPPWIRLYKTLLDDFDFQCLPDASRALAPMLWLLASEFDEGKIETTLEKLSYRFRRTESEILAALNPLVENGFFMCDSVVLANGYHRASGPLASRYQDATPETEERQRREVLPRESQEVVLEVNVNNTTGSVEHA